MDAQYSQDRPQAPVLPYTSQAQGLCYADGSCGDGRVRYRYRLLEALFPDVDSISGRSSQRPCSSSSNRSPKLSRFPASRPDTPAVANN